MTSAVTLGIRARSPSISPTKSRALYCTVLKAELLVRAGEHVSPCITSLADDDLCGAADVRFRRQHAIADHELLERDLKRPDPCDVHSSEGV